MTMESLHNLVKELVQFGVLPSAFEHAFMLRALLAACLAGPLLGSLGTLVVSKRLVFYTQTICHASLTGVAIGLFFGEPSGETYAGLYGFSTLVALVMLYVRQQTRLSSDTITGVVLAQVLGLGVITLVLVTKQFNVHQIEAILFGSLITISEQDIIILLLSFVTLAVILLCIYNRALLIGVNPVLAKMHGTPVLFIEYLTVVCLTLVIVASLKIIGALLVLALIVIPAAAAQNLVNNLKNFFWVSLLLTTFSAIGGLLISAQWSIPTGGAIVVIASVCFYLSVLAKALLNAVNASTN